MQIIQDKKAARAHARQLLSKISAAQREGYSQKAAVSFLNSSTYKNASCVAAFFSLPQEVDTLPVIARAFMDKKRVLLPRVAAGSNEMDFYELAPVIPGNDTVEAATISCLEAQSEANAWGIREPLESLPLIAKKDIPESAAILVPGLAFSKDGRRLGRGKGFYDRYLSELLLANPAFAERGKFCGYCMAIQILDSVPTEENDVFMQELYY